MTTWADMRAQSTDESLRVYATNILRDRTQEVAGYGVYLGNGLVLTAAHVVGSASKTKPSVHLANINLPARAVQEGSYDWGEDLTLLSIDDEKLPVWLRMRRVQLCEKLPWAGEPVIVVTPEGTTRSTVASPLIIPLWYRRRFPTIIKDVTGNSGAGVFDASRKCLLGIMSRKIKGRSTGPDPDSQLKDLATYFVPAWAIRSFIPPKSGF